MTEFKATFAFDNWLIVLAKVVSIGSVQEHPGETHYYFDLSLEGSLSVQRITDVDPDLLKKSRADLIGAVEDYYYCILHGFTPEQRPEAETFPTIHLDSVVEDETT